MKMKKLLWVLPAFAAVATLASCGSAGSSKISYVDEEGNKQTVDVKPTEETDAVVETLYALTKQKVSKPKEVTVNASLDAKLDATTADNKKVSYDAALKAKLQLAADLNATDGAAFMNSLAAYANVKLDGTLPSVAEVGSDNPDFTNTAKYSINAEAFLESNNAYLYFNKLEMPSFPTGGEMAIANTVVGMLKQSVLNLDLTTVIPTDAIASLDNVVPMLNSDIVIYDIIAANAGDEFSDESLKTMLAQGVEAAGISIKAVSGSTVTFNFAVDPTAKPKDELKSYKVGQVAAPKTLISIDVAVDVAKVLPKSISVDLASALTNAFEAPSGFTAFEFSKASVSVNFAYNESVKKISSAKKDAAVDATAIIDMFNKD